MSTGRKIPNTPGDPDYLAAVDVFYHRHLCRADPWPEALVKSVEQMDGNPVYLTMNGPTEFDVIGLLRDWDRSADLHRIASPTLITVGRYDELTPACARDDPGGRAGRSPGGVRGERAHRPPGGGRALRRGGGSVPA